MQRKWQAERVAKAEAQRQSEIRLRKAREASYRRSFRTGAPGWKHPIDGSKSASTLRWVWLAFFGVAALMAIAYLACLAPVPTVAAYLKAWPVFIAGALCFGASAWFLLRPAPGALAITATIAVVVGFVAYSVGDVCLASGGPTSARFIGGAATFAVGHALLIAAAVMYRYARGDPMRSMPIDDTVATALSVAGAVAAAVAVSACLSLGSVCGGGSVTAGVLALFYLLLLAAQALAFSLCWTDPRVANITMVGSLILLASDVVLLMTGPLCGDLADTPRGYAVILTYWTGFTMVAVGPYSEICRIAGLEWPSPVWME